jgi:hypothetical protein
MTTTTRPFGSLWTAFRTKFREYHHAHVTRASLDRELASYTSPADLNDLHAILDRYSDKETAEIRHILAAQQSR